MRLLLQLGYDVIGGGEGGVSEFGCTSSLIAMCLSQFSAIYGGLVGKAIRKIIPKHVLDKALYPPRGCSMKRIHFSLMNR
jgi:hypothetical protein